MKQCGISVTICGHTVNSCFPSANSRMQLKHQLRVNTNDRDQAYTYLKYRRQQRWGYCRGQGNPGKKLSKASQCLIANNPRLIIEWWSVPAQFMLRQRRLKESVWRHGKKRQESISWQCNTHLCNFFSEAQCSYFCSDLKLKLFLKCSYFSNC